MKKVIIIVVIIVGVLIILSLFNRNSDTAQVPSQESVTDVQEDVALNGALNEAPETELAGLYTQYDGNLEQYAGKDIILFFKADWCPSCRALDGDIKSKLDSIPDSVVLLELNYDTETELRKKYGVTTQHTMVHVDADGTAITKWSGGNRLEDILNQIK